jgi:serine/threonine-protein kinase
MVHCDLKPENIFLIPDPEVAGGERAKILDFGIAKFLADSGGKQTTVGLVLGTPRYMAPEQCEGRDHLTDKVDVYALGVILYEALAGRGPFLAQSSTGLMRQHMVMDPPLLRELVPGLPLAVHELVHAMLAKKNSERPTMAQVTERLQHLKMQPSAMAAAIAPRSPRRPVPRPLVAVLGGAALLAALLAGIGVSRLRHREPLRQAGSSVALLPADTGPTPLPGAVEHVPTDREPPAHLPSGPAPAAGADGGMKSEPLHKHKLGKLATKDGHPHPGEATAAPSDNPAAPPGGEVKAAPPTAPPTPASPPKPPVHNRITNGDIEPDR